MFYAKYLQQFTDPYIRNIHVISQRYLLNIIPVVFIPTEWNESQNLTQISCKYSQSLTFLGNCKHLHLIVVSKAVFVSYSSKIILFAGFHYSLLCFTICPPQHISLSACKIVEVLVQHLGVEKEDDMLMGNCPYAAQSEFCILLHFVIISVLKSAFIYLYIMSRNDFLHTDNGLFLSPTV